MSAIEGRVRKSLQDRFSRGKIDVFFKEKEPLFGGASVTIDYALAGKYYAALKKLKKDMRLEAEIDFIKTVGIDRILKVEDKGGSYDRVWGQMEKLLAKAAANMDVMRTKEGAHILKDQQKRLKKVSELVENIRGHSKRVRHGHVDRIRSKMNGSIACSGVIDEQRLQLEAALLGGRQDIAEEVVRLASHIKQYSTLLGSKDFVGRKIDFLIQEMNREINTIGSKAADADVSRLVVECKAELERLREQIQNVE